MTSFIFVGRRLFAMVVTLLVASFVVFGSLYLAPGSPITFLTAGRTVSPAAVAALNREYGLNRPFPIQFIHWLGKILQGNLGTSIVYKTSVVSLLGGRALNTLFLITYAGILIVVIGLMVGIIAALKPGWIDSVSMVGATVGMAIPGFVAAVVLTLLFAVDAHVFPVFGTGTGLGGRFVHLTLPSIALALSSVAYVARLSRSAVRNELRADHVETAISRGLPHATVLRSHVFRNAMIPITTVSALAVASLIAGSVIIEEAFQLNGLGSYLVSAVQQKDFSVVQAISLLFVSAFIVINTLVDITYAILDPRLGRDSRTR
jgi:peptide/nickel transport system permease protein